MSMNYILETASAKRLRLQRTHGLEEGALTSSTVLRLYLIGILSV